MRISDWSSDVCSSDLEARTVQPAPMTQRPAAGKDQRAACDQEQQQGPRQALRAHAHHAATGPLAERERQGVAGSEPGAGMRGVATRVKRRLERNVTVQGKRRTVRFKTGGSRNLK